MFNILGSVQGGLILEAELPEHLDPHRTKGAGRIILTSGQTKQLYDWLKNEYDKK